MAVKPWREVTESPEYKKLSPAEREAARQQYFNEVVAPKVPQGEIEAVREQFDADTKATTSLGARIGRQVGLTARAGISGVLSLPAMAGDAMIAGVNRIAGTDLPPTSQALERTLSRVGLPEPEGGVERVVYDANRGMAGGAGMAGVGMRAPATIRSMLAPAPQIVSGAGAGIGGGVAREAGFGPTGELVGAVAGAAAPAVVSGGIPTMVRGAFGRPKPENVAAFDEAGASPSVGQATGNRRTQAVESMLAKTPGSAGRMAEAGAANQAALGETAETTASRLSKVTDPTVVGKRITEGFWDRWLPDWKNKQSSLFAEVDKRIPSGYQTPITNTQQTLNKLSAPIPGAAKTSELLSNPKIQAVREALQADAQGGALPYTALKELRSKVGEMLESSEIIADAPRRQLKQLYGAMTADMEEAARANGPEAVRALARANKHTKAGHDRLDMISSTLGKDRPEDVVRAALDNTKEGATRLRAIMRSIPPDARQPLQAYVIRRLGKAKSGMQNEAGDVFSTETFLTNWNNISPEAKMQLFTDDATRKSLDAIASTAARIREGSKVYANPSGTQPAMSMQLGAGGAIVATLTGNYGIAGAIGGTMGIANLSARLMTNPRFVRWLGQANRVSLDQVPAQLNALAVTEKDRQDFADLQALLEKQNQNPQ